MGTAKNLFPMGAANFAEAVASYTVSGRSSPDMIAPERIHIQDQPMELQRLDMISPKHSAADGASFGYQNYNAKVKH